MAEFIDKYVGIPSFLFRRKVFPANPKVLQKLLDDGYKKADGLCIFESDYLYVKNGVIHGGNHEQL